MLTKHVPGRISTKIQQDLDKYQDPRAAFFVQDLERSVVNYIEDADDNMYLVMHNQIASICSGYNNPNLLKAATSS